MTCIVTKFATKRALVEHCKVFGNCPVNSALDFYIDNPSSFPAGTFEYAGMVSLLPVGKKVIVTNHPKRSWFATIERKPDGFRVS